MASERIHPGVSATAAPPWPRLNTVSQANAEGDVAFVESLIDAIHAVA